MRYKGRKPVCTYAKIHDGIATIAQKRKITESGEYHYQIRRILSGSDWVKTGPWSTHYKKEIGRNILDS